MDSKSLTTFSENEETQFSGRLSSSNPSKHRNSLQNQQKESLMLLEEDQMNNNQLPFILREPIVFTSNPLKTWVAFVSCSLLCITLSFTVIIKWSYLWYLSITLAAFSAALAVQAKRERFTFDICTGRCTMQTWSILGASTQEWWFHEIKEVSLEESTDTQGGTEVDLYLVLRSGKKINMFCNHLCGLEARFKRDVWAQVSNYLHGSRTQNALEWIERENEKKQDEVEMTPLKASMH